MGLDLDVLLLVGVDYSDVVVEFSDYITTTKYNPDNGTPYELTKEKFFYKVGDKVFTDIDDADDFIGGAGLSIYEECGEGALVGIELDRNRGERVAIGLGGYVTVSDIESAIKEVSRLLEDIGVENTAINIRTYSTANW